ncbi:MAG: DNA/pantothenate metabolism flavoprotein domain protein [Verrucomicrobia bacterium]|jgi:phosphopantothenate---cysteine ligase (CTP)|nr:DNA/pantothenate metabolism flavoprotein domain protein [Verrucomicrobiota bacterium]
MTYPVDQKTALHCVITAGPTYESLDQVRRLTNFSTGSLGAQFSAYLCSKGIRVTLLTGYYVTYEGAFEADSRIPFTTTTDLADKLKHLNNQKVDAIFHAAAVSDFAFGKVWEKPEQGEMEEIVLGKISTRSGTLLAELVPTPKILPQLRHWFPNAYIVGWKYEVEGSKEKSSEKAIKQLNECQTDACVLNGPAIGDGFEVYPKNQKQPTSLTNRPALFKFLRESLLDSKNA